MQGKRNITGRFQQHSDVLVKRWEVSKLLSYKIELGCNDMMFKANLAESLVSENFENAYINFFVKMNANSFCKLVFSLKTVSHELVNDTE